MYEPKHDFFLLNINKFNKSNEKEVNQTSMRYIIEINIKFCNINYLFDCAKY